MSKHSMKMMCGCAAIVLVAVVVAVAVGSAGYLLFAVPCMLMMGAMMWMMMGGPSGSRGRDQK